MNTVEIIQDRGIEGIGRYYSKYRGVVIKSDQEHLQKLLVVVPCIQNGIKVWAKPSQQQGGIQYGIKYLTPLPGEVVWVEFEKGNPFRAIWSYHGWADDEMPEDLANDTTMGFVTPQGNKVILNDTDGALSIFLKNSSTIEIEEGCKLHLTKDNLTITKGEDTTITLTDDEITLSKGGDTSVTISSKGISLKKGSNDLKSILGDLISEISGLTIVTPTGAGTVNPTNIANLRILNQKISQLLF